MIRSPAFKIAHSSVPGFYWSDCLRRYTPEGNGDDHSVYAKRSRAIAVAEEVDGIVVKVKRSLTWAEVGT